ncbi:hypothetical protein D6T63_12745 [Arthrobacter cheniae]|uniref:Secreted protein n=1 Tax=Arthrobacter cheniae TaxID=1258888 RepID=A0A3A5M4A7_9MICC|nr:hypothetical protein [Arthrobacter cheniae]RJT78374.1 hypothetical protein D6T63_12745 [Arthrobacter cheniae]
MNRLTPLIIACGAGLALALTASPALAAPPTSSGNSNGAQLERRDLSFPDGTYEYHTVTRQHGGYYYTTNSRDQSTYQDGDSQSSFDYKTQYTELENVTKLTSQSTSTENGETCRTNSQFVVANGETRRESPPSSC